MNKLPTINLNPMRDYVLEEGYSWADQTQEVAYPQECKEEAVGFFIKSKVKPKYLLYSSYQIVGRASATNLQRVLNSVEKEMEFPLSRVKFLEKRNKTCGTVLVSFSKRWVKSSVLLHFFCLLLRSGFQKSKNWRIALRNGHDAEDFDWNGDGNQVKICEKVITEIVHDKGKLRTKPRQKEFGLCDYAELRKFTF